MQDAELVGAVRTGDRQAYATLVERYRQHILRLCYRVAGNLPDAEDLAHEAFVEAYVKLDQLRDPEKFAPWLRALALNLCRAWYRRSRRADVELTEEVAAEPAGEETLTRLLICGGLSHLSAPHRLALALHYGEGLSYEEVAAFLDLPPGTVMSRLHRARHRLKQIMTQMRKDEEMTTTPEGEFGREVEAEIDALLTLAGESSRIRERLSVLLRHTPERFALLIRQAEHAAALDNLALLLLRAGRPAMEVVLDCYLSPDEPLRANAALLLARFVGRDKPGTGDQPWARIAGRGVYLLLDILFQARAADSVKAELLIELLEVAPDERTALLFLSALLCYREAAFPLLLERFWSMPTVEDLHRSADLLHALCRTGTQFAAVLLEPLRNGDTRQQTLALAGAEALARALRSEWYETAADAREGLSQLFGGRPAPSPAGTEGLSSARSGDTTSDARVLLEQRFRRKWAPPLQKDRDPAILATLAERVAVFTTDNDCAELRNAALRTLGLLADRTQRGHIQAALTHPELATRVAALRALADAADPEPGAHLIHAADSPEAVERRVAVEILGQLRVTEALPLLRERLDDPDKQIQRATATALGQLGNEDARALLRPLCQSPDKLLARAAISALLSETPAPPTARPVPEPAQRTTAAQRMRGDAQPPFAISLEAALRLLPDTQPCDEITFSRRLAQACVDYASTRRYLVEDGLVQRDGGIYRLTAAGEVAWRVERFLVTDVERS
jgi:RNA polymerase sigma factor (sigma-70 family)